MTAAFNKCFLFLRNPRGGVENLLGMKQAGFEGVFVNIRDYPVEDWDVIRYRAQEQGMFCGPWARTADANNNWSSSLLHSIIEVADDWGSPLIVNSESEIKGTGNQRTKEIADAIGDRDGAVSMEPIPFANVDWTPLADIPVLPQCFGPEYANAGGIRDSWHAYGVNCVYPTFGTYSGWAPSVYPLKAPYSLYTGDDCGNNFGIWSPTSTGYKGCKETVPPTNGGTVPPGNEIPPVAPGDIIGSEHGITAFVDWVQKQPGMPVRTDKYDPAKPGTWPWPERLERTLKILASYHDIQLTQAPAPMEEEVDDGGIRG